MERADKSDRVATCLLEAEMEAVMEEGLSPHQQSDEGRLNQLLTRRSLGRHRTPQDFTFPCR